jgi:hypothetical protein
MPEPIISKQILSKQIMPQQSMFKPGPNKTHQGMSEGEYV